MPDMGMVIGALESAKSIGGMVRSLAGLNTSAEVNKVAMELQMQILDLIGKLQEARTSEFEIAEKLRELEVKLENKDAFQRELENYSLMSPWPGAYVYARRFHVEVRQAPHYLCTRCVENKVKSILQGLLDENHWAYYSCPNCKILLRTGYKSAPEAQYA